MRQTFAIMCAAAAAASAAFTVLSDHEIRVTASSSPAAKSSNDEMAVSQNSTSKGAEVRRAAIYRNSGDCSQIGKGKGKGSGKGSY